MRLARHISDNRIDPPCDMHAERVTKLAEEIAADLRTKGRWYSAARPDHHEYDVADCVSEIYGLTDKAGVSEEARLHVALATIYESKGQPAEDITIRVAVGTIRGLLDRAIDVTAKQLAEREIEALNRD